MNNLFTHSDNFKMPKKYYRDYLKKLELFLNKLENVVCQQSVIYTNPKESVLLGTISLWSFGFKKHCNCTI